MAELFQDDVIPEDRLYGIVRDDPDEVNHRQFVERLWRFFEPFADGDFALAIAKDFHARFWEMYLAFGLNNCGHRLLPLRKSGPDLLIEGPDRPIWIEAVAATKGTGVDQVPEKKLNVVQDVPDEKVVLRFRQSIDEKFKKLLRYQERGIVDVGDPFVIALNGRRVPFAENEPEIPRILKALFPLGHVTVTINRETMEKIDERHGYRPHIEKASGGEVPTTLFVGEEYCAVSAVLFCNSDLGNRPSDDREIGEDFTLVHNPHAQNPIPHEWLRCGREFWAKGDKLVGNDWWKSRCGA